MKSLVQRSSKFLAAAALLAVAPLVQAVTVTYYTTGTFDSHVASVNAITHYQQDTITSSGITLTYRNDDVLEAPGVGDHSVLLNSADSYSSQANFGYFQASGLGTNVNFGTHTFTLTFYQLDPTIPGSNPAIAGELSGVITRKSGGSGNASSLEIAFNPTSVYVTPEAPSFLYALTNLNPGNVFALTPGSTSLTGNVSAVPLPSVAGLGTGLLGLLALKRNRRSTEVSQA